MSKTYPNAPAFNEVQGLTKREYFAAIMMSSHWSDNVEKSGFTYRDYAEIAVGMADALIEELNKVNNKGGNNE